MEREIGFFEDLARTKDPNPNPYGNSCVMLQKNAHTPGEQHERILLCA